jgi:hypothetical protein
MGVAGPYQLKTSRNPVNGVRHSSQKKAGMTVAKIIKFYIPSNFRRSVKWVSPEKRGKILEFAVQTKKSA